MKKRFSIYIALWILFSPLVSAKSEPFKDTKVSEDKQKELTAEEIEIINNYELLETFQVLNDWELFENYEVFIDTNTE